MHGGSDVDTPLSALTDLYDELGTTEFTDGEVTVENVDCGWYISAYRNGSLVFEDIRTLDPGSERHMKHVPKERVIEYWNRLVAGDIEGLLAEPWEPGYP
jgi:hypothetical protein